MDKVGEAQTVPCSRNASRPRPCCRRNSEMGACKDFPATALAVSRRKSRDDGGGAAIPRICNIR